MKKIYTIGRDEGCDIVIPDSTDVISRLHATIRVESNDKIFLIDQSRNGTYVNGMKMSSNVEIPVSRKDVVSFAHIYNLDWSLVPKHKGNTIKTIFIILGSLIVMTGIAYAIISKIPLRLKSLKRKKFIILSTNIKFKSYEVNCNR